MINTPHIGDARQEGRRGAIKEAITPAASAASRASTSRCTSSYKQGRIGLEEALDNADSRTNLEAKINFGWSHPRAAQRALLPQYCQVSDSVRLPLPR